MDSKDSHVFDIELKSERLLLRKIKYEDAEDMYDYTSSEECTKYLSWSPHSNLEQTKEYINKIIDSYRNLSEYTWGIELRPESKFIGVVRMFDISYANKRLEISYIMNPYFQGKGLMTEAIGLALNHAFKNVQINRVQARCTVDNLSSEKVMRKLRMIHEGILKQYWMIKGEFKDATLYAITAERFNK